MASEHLSADVHKLIQSISGSSGLTDFQCIVIVEDSERHLGEKLRKEMVDVLGRSGRIILSKMKTGVLLLDTVDLKNETVVDHFTEAVRRGVLMLPLLTEKLCQCKTTLNLLYHLFITEMK